MLNALEQLKKIENWIGKAHLDRFDDVEKCFQGADLPSIKNALIEKASMLKAPNSVLTFLKDLAEEHLQYLTTSGNPQNTICH